MVVKHVAVVQLIVQAGWCTPGALACLALCPPVLAWCPCLQRPGDPAEDGAGAHCARLVQAGQPPHRRQVGAGRRCNCKGLLFILATATDEVLWPACPPWVAPVPTGRAASRPAGAYRNYGERLYVEGRLDAMRKEQMVRGGTRWLQPGMGTRSGSETRTCVAVRLQHME